MWGGIGLFSFNLFLGGICMCRIGKFCWYFFAVLLGFSSLGYGKDLKGQVAPPLNARRWLNVSGDLSLAALRRKRVVFLEFFATW